MPGLFPTGYNYEGLLPSRKNITGNSGDVVSVLPEYADGVESIFLDTGVVIITDSGLPIVAVTENKRGRVFSEKARSILFRILACTRYIRHHHQNQIVDDDDHDDDYYYDDGDDGSGSVISDDIPRELAPSLRQRCLSIFACCIRLPKFKKVDGMWQCGGPNVSYCIGDDYGTNKRGASSPASDAASPAAGNTIRSSKRQRRRVTGRYTEEYDITSDNDEELFSVEKIVDSKIDKNGVQLYKCRWKGYTAADDTWEPTENVSSTGVSVIIIYCVIIAILMYPARVSQSMISFISHSLSCALNFVFVYNCSM